MATKSAAGFETTYSELYGARWLSLKEALLEPPRQVERWNVLCGEPEPDSLLKIQLGSQKVAYRPREKTETETVGPLDSAGLKKFYTMDLASVAPALSLQVQSSDQVLDLCAAPGGKSLILAEALGEEGQLVCNELSAARRSRLLRVLREYLPAKQRSELFFLE
jgi:16S rRNA C967 or C1407 C5-methylase (RsmB/RsmF family)